MEILLKAKARSGSGKGVSRKLRHAGRMPCVLYGPQREPVHLTLERNDAEKILSGVGRRKIIDLEFENSPDTTRHIQVMFKDIQRHAITRELLHIDFYEITQGQKISTDIPVVMSGKAVGVEDHGGALQFLTRTIRIQCLPKDLPEYLEVDVSHLDIGDSISVADIPMDRVLTCLEEPDRVIASVITVRTAAVEEEAKAEEEAAEGEESAAEAESSESE
ncbi:50S ribosomal protein L25 [bacterium]|nr:50S ribosomal protein L25 [candidate division CSSED10-310 bacterium]